MAKIRKETFKEMFEDPEAELVNFLNSGQAIMALAFSNTTKLIELNQRDAANLLIEIRADIPWRCDYCLIINPGTEMECVGCGAERI